MFLPSPQLSRGQKAKNGLEMGNVEKPKFGSVGGGCVD